MKPFKPAAWTRGEIRLDFLRVMCYAYMCKTFQKDVDAFLFNGARNEQVLR